jgi:hypothetical protein
MQPILNILVGLIRDLSEKKGLPWAIALIIFIVVIYVVCYVMFVPRNVNYPRDLISPDYQRNMHYIMSATENALPDLSKSHIAIFGSYLAIVDEDDLPLLTKKLRYQFLKADYDDLSLYYFVLGGMDVSTIDKPLLAASKKLSGQANIQITIVAPTTVSIETKAILEKRGIKLRLIGPP